MVMSVCNSAVRYHFSGSFLFRSRGLNQKRLSFNYVVALDTVPGLLKTEIPKMELLSRFARSSQDSGDEFNDLANNHDISRSVVS